MKKMFRNDYCELAHERILRALLNAKDEQNVGYGLDKHSENARNLIKDIFKLDNPEIQFLAGGTQVNMTVISYLLKPYEAVISCDTGHINVHETGAVEGSGNKIVVVPNVNGKVTAEEVEKVMRLHRDEHMVKIKMVYISNSTEIGTIYYKDELLKLREVCDKYGLYLFLDGARLGSALTCKVNDVTCELIGQVCDAFYIGGTKNGTLYGEAVVLANKTLFNDFRYHIKNKGAMLSKGFSLGIQFEELFKDGLFFEIGCHENEMADLIKQELLKLNIEFIKDSPTNQIFVDVDKKMAHNLINEYGCELWEEKEYSTVVRIVTSFNTTVEAVNELLADLRKWVNK